MTRKSSGTTALDFVFIDFKSVMFADTNDLQKSVSKLANFDFLKKNLQRKTCRLEITFLAELVSRQLRQYIYFLLNIMYLENNVV
jgi:hypothetical protein